MNFYDKDIAAQSCLQMPDSKSVIFTVGGKE